MPKRYDPKHIEPKWQKKWRTAGVYEPDMKRAPKPFYNLMMFPYPSAEGLHIGGMRTFTGVDIYGRFKRMNGRDVFEPIGLDGFGINSENYALKTGRHPMKQAVILEKNFYRQLTMMGNGFAWNERLQTYDPDYYCWTQWLFVFMFKRGLAYRKKQAVNWCPCCKTVLADEQVISGECERCSTKVIKKQLEQWFFRITNYVDRLLKNLDTIDWSENIKIAQRNWIGKKEGIVITYLIEYTKETVSVFTTRPDTNFGATFIVLAPENGLGLDIALPEYRDAVRAYSEEAAKKTEEERIEQGRKKTGVFTGRYAKNHLTGRNMPIWVSDFVISSVGTGAVVGVPAHDLRDFEFAKEFDIEIIRVVAGKDGDTSPITRPEQVQEEEGIMVNSGFLNGLDIHKATSAVMDHLEKNAWGKRTTQYRLRDWLISRQRYWGPPIPMIFCAVCKAAEKGERSDMPGWYTVKEKDLPVRLPFVKEFRPTGTDQSPLAKVTRFYKVRCPSCRSWARRETDVSDTFLDSAWYFLRYPNAKNKKAAWDPAITKKWLPVDMYIGGAEHAVLHLLYARFVTMALRDAKLLSFEEPFKTFRSHGLITKDGAKMSKSKGNVVNPDDYVRAYGTDAVRMYLAFLAPFDQGGDFRDEGIRGITRFLDRVWKLATAIEDRKITANSRKKNSSLTPFIHQTIKKVGEDIESLHYNTAISALMILLNRFEERIEEVDRTDLGVFLALLAPFAPHITEEFWQLLKFSKKGKFSSIHHERWPSYKPTLIREEIFELVVQVNGKVRGRVSLPCNAPEQEARSAAEQIEQVRVHLSGTPKKIIFIPNKIINFVV